MSKTKIGIYMAALLIAIWAIGGVNIVLNGEAAMGTTDRVPWGGMIGGYEFFAVMSTGLTMIGVLGIVFNFEKFNAILKRTLILAVACQTAAFSIIGLELGRPQKGIFFMLSPNFTSPILWMSMIYGLYFGLLLLTVYSIFKLTPKITKLLAKAVFVAAIVAVANIGNLFGFVNARPYWSTSILAAYFIIGAVLSGAALLLVVMHFVEKKKNTPKSESIVPSLQTIYAVTLGLTFIMLVVKTVYGMYGGVYGKYEATMALVSGPLSIYFWVFEVLIGLLIPIGILLFAKSLTSDKLAMAGGMTLFGIFFMRYDFVIAGQLVPLKVVDGLKEVVYHTYHTALPAWGVIVGALGLALLVYIIADDKLPLDSDEQTKSNFSEKADKAISAKA